MPHNYVSGHKGLISQFALLVFGIAWGSFVKNRFEYSKAAAICCDAATFCLDGGGHNGAGKLSSPLIRFIFACPFLVEGVRTVTLGW